MARLEIAGFRLQLYQRLRCKPSKNRLLFIENSKMSVVQDELLSPHFPSKAYPLDTGIATSCGALALQGSDAFTTAACG
jgi:hypothetical protein